MRYAFLLYVIVLMTGGTVIGYLIGLDDGLSSCGVGPEEQVKINGIPVPLSEANAILEKSGSAFRFHVDEPE